MYTFNETFYIIYSINNYCIATDIKNDKYHDELFIFNIVYMCHVVMIIIMKDEANYI